MLPADTIAEITTNLAGLHLEANITAQILAAVFAPLLRSSDSESPELAHKRAARRRLRARKAPQRMKAKRGAPRRKYTRGPTDARERARTALKANPGLSLTRIAKAAGVSRSTVVNAGKDLAAEAGKEARGKPAKAAEPAERRERAQRFLREQLGRGPRSVSDIEAAAVKAHVDEVALGQARADLGVITSRSNSPGNALSVQWSLPR